MDLEKKLHIIAMSCPVCCETFTEYKRKPVGCNYCHFSACMACVQKYILGSSSDPDCMSCHKPWNREFLDHVCTKAFVNGELKKHREQVLLEREQALLPASQGMVGNYREAMHLREVMHDQGEALRAATEELARLRREFDLTRYHLGWIEGHGYRRSLAELGDRRAGDTEEQHRSFIRACPAEGCRGFLSTAWKCGTCSTWVCPDCHELKGIEKDAPHTCDPKNVATAQLLKRDSKPCPKCASLITKIEGCSQIWCTQCHTPFDWRTGQIVTHGVIHNPHYYEWQRQQNGGVAPRVPGDVPCGGLPGVWELENSLRAHHVPQGLRLEIMDCHRIIRHIQHVDMHGLANQYNVNDNADLRLAFLIKVIDEAEWKRKLQQREKKREKELALRHIYEMFTVTGSEILHEVVNGAKAPRAAALQLRSLQEYANTSIDKVASRFGANLKRIRTGARYEE